MEIGPVVIGMSIVVFTYLVVAVYLATRTMWRCVRDAPAHPVRLRITIDEGTLTALAKRA